MFYRFPAKPDGLVPEERIEERVHQLEDYLQSLLEIPIYRNHYETVSKCVVINISVKLS